MRTRIPALLLSSLLVLGLAACDSSTEADVETDGQVETDPGTTGDLGTDELDGSIDGSVDGELDTDVAPTE